VLRPYPHITLDLTWTSWPRKSAEKIHFFLSLLWPPRSSSLYVNSLTLGVVSVTVVLVKQLKIFWPGGKKGEDKRSIELKSAGQLPVWGGRFIVNVGRR